MSIQISKMLTANAYWAEVDFSNDGLLVCGSGNNERLALINLLEKIDERIQKTEDARKEIFGKLEELNQQEI